jgi:hypothetical protein
MKRCYFLWLTLTLLPLAPEARADHLQVSLLTVDPRDSQVYTLYGHTALRLSDPTQQIDAVFNWGTFDFHAPHFLYRFVRGETDYFLSLSTYEQFLFAYRLDNARVVEQVLSLSPEGKAALLEKLNHHLLPENRTYRYDFLFDNCTTRVRDLIEQCIPGISYPQTAIKTTFRKQIHSCTASHRWMTFGIDLVIGNGADSLIGTRQELFLPVRLKETLDKSQAAGPVVASTREVLAAAPESGSAAGGCSPSLVGFLLLALGLLMAIAGWKQRRSYPLAFVLLFTVAGAAGCVLAFMAAFSSHPCLWPNWNLLWLHPLHLLAAIGSVGRFFPRVVLRSYHTVNVVLLCSLLLLWNAIPQALHPANVPFILCLALASGYWILTNKNQHPK